MVYECEKCGNVLLARALACPICGEGFDKAVPMDAEVPEHGRQPKSETRIPPVETSHSQIKTPVTPKFVISQEHHPEPPKIIKPIYRQPLFWLHFGNLIWLLALWPVPPIATLLNLTIAKHREPSIIFTIFALAWFFSLLGWPISLFLLWRKTHWPLKTKIAVTVVLPATLLLCAAYLNSPQVKARDAEEKQESAREQVVSESRQKKADALAYQNSLAAAKAIHKSKVAKEKNEAITRHNKAMQDIEQRKMAAKTVAEQDARNAEQNRLISKVADERLRDFYMARMKDDDPYFGVADYKKGVDGAVIINHLIVSVDNKFFSQPYQVRLEEAQNLVRDWKNIYGNGSTTVDIVDGNGDYVGGTGLFGQGVVVKKDL